MDESFVQHNTWGSRTTLTYKDQRRKEMRSLWSKTPNISVTFPNPSANLSSDATRATVSGKMNYRSPRYNSDGHLRLELIYRYGSWKILEEHFVGIDKWK